MKEGRSVVHVVAPGRINLIGEHTDYNDGFVLPAAIDKALHFRIDSSSNDGIIMRATDLKEEVVINMGDIEKSELDWVNYCLGILDQLRQRNIRIEPFVCEFGGDIPLGAGLSSSAALTCGFLFSLNEYFELGLTKIEMAKMAQRSEWDFMDVKCGIMDQYACLFGEENSFIKLDCRSLDHEVISGDFTGYDLLLCNTNVKHSLADTAYNERRSQCEVGVAKMKMLNPAINALRDASLSDLDNVKEHISNEVYQRCEYVIEENARVVAAVEAIRSSNMLLLGELIYQSHDGLSKKYEVSCRELDVLVEIAKSSNQVTGARMMGGGFGGCTINLIKSEGVQEFKQLVEKQYKQITGLDVTFYDINISKGLTKIEVNEAV